jgi:hypothetical protein
MTRKVLGKFSSWRIVNQVNQDMQAGSQLSTQGRAHKIANLGSLAKRNLEFLNQVPPTGNLEFFVCARNKHPQTPFAKRMDFERCRWIQQTGLNLVRQFEEIHYLRNARSGNALPHGDSRLTKLRINLHLLAPRKRRLERM